MLNNDYPKWAPKLLCALSHISHGGNEQRYLDCIRDLLYEEWIALFSDWCGKNFGQAGFEILDKLIFDERMRIVWESFSRHNLGILKIKGVNIEGRRYSLMKEGRFSILQHGKVTQPEFVVFARIGFAHNGPNGYYALSKADRTERLKDIQKHCKALAKAIEPTPVDIDMELRSILGKSNKSPLSDGLRNFGVQVIDKYTERENILPSPNAVDSRATYFVSYLHSFFKATFDRPLWNALVNITAVVLDKEDCDLQYVRNKVGKRNLPFEKFAP